MRIKLLKPHRHQGTSYLVGAIIDTDLDTANYLASLKVAAVHIDPPTIVQGSPPSTNNVITPESNRTASFSVPINTQVPVVSSFESKNPPTGIMPEIVKT